MPTHVPVCVLGNYRDMGEHRVILPDDVRDFIDNLDRWVGQPMLRIRPCPLRSGSPQAGSRAVGSERLAGGPGTEDGEPRAGSWLPGTQQVCGGGGTLRPSLGLGVWLMERGPRLRARAQAGCHLLGPLLWALGPWGCPGIKGILAQVWPLAQRGCALLPPRTPSPSGAIVLFANRPPGSSYFRYAESSMKNSFGLKYLHKFFNIPFLQLQVSPPAG